VPLRPQRRVTPGPGTAKEAKAYADYIGVHLQGIGKGKSYSEVSAESMKDSNNKELAQQRLAMFMGETLRGMLLNAWGWGTLGTIVTIGGIVLILIGNVLLAIPLLAGREARRSAAAARVGGLTCSVCRAGSIELRWYAIGGSTTTLSETRCDS
jgi:hypothetical protein